MLFLFVSCPNAKEIYVFNKYPTASTSSEKFPRAKYYSIQAAINACRPGDTVIISGGVYNENVTMMHFGNPNKWTNIRAEEGKDVIINGGSQDAAAFLVAHSQYIAIDGLHFTNAQKHGLAFIGSNNLTATNCRASYNKLEGFLSYNSSKTDFKNCIGHDNIGDSFNYHKAKDSIITDCFQYRGGNGLSIERGSENILVEDNIFYDNWVDGILVYADCKNITIKNNIIYSIHFKNPLDNGQGHCIKITHKNENVIVENNKCAKCAAAFSYEIAENKSVIYSNNLLEGIGRRIPVTPVYSWKGDVLYKGLGDYPKFFDCTWYNLKDIEKYGWGKNNLYDNNLIIELENKIKQLKNSGVIFEQNENITNQ